MVILRYIFAFLVFVHGLIHLMGFAKAFHYAEISALNRPISKPSGLLWLLAASLFVAAAILLVAKNLAWWIPAIVGIVLSQILILGVWSDAKFGTIANVLIAIVSIVAYGSWNFHSTNDEEVRSLLLVVDPGEKTVTEGSIVHLPDVVQIWLRRSNVVGKKMIQTVFLRQEGVMRTSPEGKWMSVEAEQYSTVENPAFIWMADVKMAPLIHLAGRDKYIDGKGSMLIQLLYFVPVVNAAGSALDQGALLRYLGELIWFPTAVLADYIQWEQVDAHSAKATMSYGGVTASATFSFSPEGDMKKMEAMRYFDRKTGATLEKWRVEADPSGYREFEGIRIPASLAITWKLKEGDFTWFKLQVTELRYNTFSSDILK